MDVRKKESLGSGVGVSRRAFLKLCLVALGGLALGEDLLSKDSDVLAFGGEVDPREYGGGVVETNYRPFLEDIGTRVVVSVNINDGTAAIWLLGVGGSREPLFTTQALVGRRLRLDAGAGERFERSRFGETGTYDGERGIFYPTVGVARHSLTRPMMAQVEGVMNIAGFAGEGDTGTSVGVLSALRRGGVDEFHSNISLHESPRIPYYEGRDVLLGQGWLDNPFETGGCINFSRSDWRVIAGLLREGRELDGAFVVLSYPGVDQEQLLLGPGETMRDDPFDSFWGNDYWYWS